ncbi:hypothetical protein Q5752_006817 [Cryptotrichosporon argae]
MDIANAEPGPSKVGPIRTSQREVKSCGFCYRRKVKCDKVFPCSRCVSRGLGDLCVQESVIVNGRLTGPNDRTVRRQPTLPQLIEENKSLHRKLNAQEKIIRSLMDQVQQAQGGERVVTPRTDEDDEGESTGSRSAASTPEPDVRAGEFERAEYLATMGQVFGLSGKETPSGQQPNQLFTQPNANTLDSLRALVPLKHSPFLVRWHCQFLHWIHPVFHVPTFLREHDEWICAILEGRAPERSYGYYALYYAIISCSLYFMDEELAVKLGMNAETIAMLPRFWFDTSINCLQLSGFMTYPTLTTLQAICVLPMIAHALDHSKYLASLMHCAVGLARDLNFHLLTANTPTAAYGGNVRAELVRRTWWCLKLSDSLSPAAQYPFHLTYPEAWTSPPANVDDHEISDDFAVTPHELSHTTAVSHLLLMARLGDLFRDFCHAFSTKQSINARYRCVKSFDERLDHLFDDVPALRPDDNEVYALTVDQTPPFDWRPWSRFLWASAVSTCRIQIYRWFLGRSYGDDRFVEVRQICVRAARQTLAVREVAVPAMFQKNWHVSSYTVISGMVLAIELLHGAPGPADARRLRHEVDEVLALLRAITSPNAMVHRGIEILDKMLADVEAAKAAQAAAAAAVPPADFAGAVPGLVPDDLIPTWPQTISLDMDADLLSILLNGDSWANTFPDGDLAL